jgi:hypothetical protein
VLALGDVERKALAKRRPSVGWLDAHGHVLDPEHTVVLGAHSILVPKGFSARVRQLLLGDDPCTIGFVDRLLEKAGDREPFLRSPTEDCFDLRTDVHRLLARIVARVDVGDQRKLLDQRSVAELGRAEQRSRHWLCR